MSTFDGPYVIEFGDVWHVGSVTGPFSRRDHVADGTENLGIVYDGETGTLLKHGNSSAVEAWLTRRRDQAIQAGIRDMVDGYQAVYFPISPETVQELNACIACSGRVLAVGERLQEIGVEHPELLNRPVYPPR